MLSWSIGRAIARVDGGKHHNKTLKLDKDYDPNKIIEISDPITFLTDSFFRNKNRKMSAIQLNKLYQAINRKREPEDEFLAEVYNEAMNILKDKARSEIKLDDGKLVPLPNRDENQGERIFIAGPTGSGKSTYASKYIKEFKKSHPKKDFFIFSKVEQDDILDKLRPTRIKIDESLLENPIDIKELKNSIVLFDDIETFGKKLADNVRELREDILQEGRHHKIWCISTNHQLMQYQKTRNLINECSCVTFFPQSGSSYHIKRFLTVYCGLDKKEVEKILKLPSRWVTIHKNFPLYCMYETGCFLLGNNNKVKEDKHDNFDEMDLYEDSEEEYSD